jgi:cell pole-organizing protein PopZ
MNAAETLKQTAAAADQRAYEPSMEEILASIRRIIADDQSLPNRAFVRDSEATLRAALDSPEAPSMSEATMPIETAVEEAAAAAALAAPEPAHGVEEEPVEEVVVAPSPRIAVNGSHGHIAAPQYAMPDIPVFAPAEHATDEHVATFVPWHTPVAEEPAPVHIAAEARGPLARHEPIALEDVAPVPETPVVPNPADDHRSEAITQEIETDAMSSLFSAATDQTVTAAFNTLAASRLLENDDVLQDMVRDMIRPLLKSWLDDNLPNMVERLVRAEIERVSRGGR